MRKSSERQGPGADDLKGFEIAQDDAVPVRRDYAVSMIARRRGRRQDDGRAMPVCGAGVSSSILTRLSQLHAHKAEMSQDAIARRQRELSEQRERERG